MSIHTIPAEIVSKLGGGDNAKGKEVLRAFERRMAFPRFDEARRQFMSHVQDLLACGAFSVAEQREEIEATISAIRELAALHFEDKA